MTVRAMRLTDAEAVAELTTELGYPVDVPIQRARIADIEAEPGDDTLLVATDEADRPIGWIHISRERSLVASRNARIGGLIVADGVRSAGIGAALLEAGESAGT